MILPTTLVMSLTPSILIAFKIAKSRTQQKNQGKFLRHVSCRHNVKPRVDLHPCTIRIYYKPIVRGSYIRSPFNSWECRSSLSDPTSRSLISDSLLIAFSTLLGVTGEFHNHCKRPISSGNSRWNRDFCAKLHSECNLVCFPAFCGVFPRFVTEI